MAERRQKQVFQTAGCGLMMVARFPLKRAWSANLGSMSLACLLKSRRLVQLLLLPNSVQDAPPDVGQSSHGDTMAFALRPFPLILRFGPGFLQCTLPGELVQGIAPGLDAAQTAMGLLVHPTLEEDWRG